MEDHVQDQVQQQHAIVMQILQISSPNTEHLLLETLPQQLLSKLHIIHLQ
jgi:hypothetical protein